MEIPKIKKTVVIGASANPSRYSYAAVNMLSNAGYPVVALGIKEDQIGKHPILSGFPEIGEVHTVSLYLSPKNQPPYYQYILDILKPVRIVFNPGTENNEFKHLAKDHQIEVVENCTLQMLTFGTF